MIKKLQQVLALRGQSLRASNVLVRRSQRLGAIRTGSEQSRPYGKERRQGRSEKSKGLYNDVAPRPLSHQKDRISERADDKESSPGLTMIAKIKRFLASLAAEWNKAHSQEEHSQDRRAPAAQTRTGSNPKWVASEPRPGVTFEILALRHERLTKAWKASKQYRDLVTFFTETILPNDNIKIDICVCLALGTLSGKGWTTTYRAYDHSMSQLVAFQSLVEILGWYQPPFLLNGS